MKRPVNFTAIANIRFNSAMYVQAKEIARLNHMDFSTLCRQSVARTVEEYQQRKAL
jgi:hypothetical protein